MVKFWCFFLFGLIAVLPYNQLKAQVQDSLVKALSLAEETAKPGIILEIHKKLHRRNPRKVISYLKQGINLCKGNKCRELPELQYSIAICYYLIGDLKRADSAIGLSIKHYTEDSDTAKIVASNIVWGMIKEATGLYKEARNIYFESLQLATRIDHDDLILKVKSNIGTSYLRQRDYAKAISYQLEVIDGNSGLPKHSQAIDHMNIGISYKNIGLYQKAIHHYLQALQLNEKVDSLSSSTAKTLHNLGTLYLDLELNAEAETCLKRAIRIKKIIGNQRSLVQSYNSLARYYRKEKNYWKARDLVNEIIAIDKLEGNPRAGAGFNFKGILFEDAQQYDSAHFYYNQALQVSLRNSNERIELASYINLGSLYLKTRDFDSSIVYSLKALELNKSLRVIGSEKGILSNLNSAYSSMGRYQEAHYYLSQYRDITDSLDLAENSKKALQMDIERQIKAKEQEIMEKNQALIISQREAEVNKQNNNYLIVIVVLLVLIAVLSIAYLRRRVKYATVEKSLIQNEFDQLLKEEQKLKEALLQKENQLTGYLLNITNKSELFHEMEQLINSIQASDQTDSATLKKIHELKQVISQSKTFEHDWRNFNIYFEKIHPNFFKSLTEKYPDLSNVELRYCALLKLKMTNREIASTLNVTLYAVNKAKYRLSKKMGKSSAEEVVSYILSL